MTIAGRAFQLQFGTAILMTVRGFNLGVLSRRTTARGTIRAKVMMRAKGLNFGRHLPKSC